MDMENYFKFVKFCNEKVSSQNEYIISRVLLLHIHDMNRQSLENISREANISQASISRFISKLGFPSFQEFKHYMQLASTQLSLSRRLSVEQNHSRQNPEQTARKLLDDSLENLQATYEIVNFGKMQMVLQTMQKARTITIVGDTHELACFYMLQLDLLANGIPCQLTNISDLDRVRISKLGPDDVILYLEVFCEWFDTTKADFLNRLYEKGVQIISFSQDNPKLDACSTIHVTYGVAGSSNDGYYSLFYINRLLSQFFYRPRLL